MREPAAERTFELSADRRVSVRIFPARPDDNSWRCDWEIEWPTSVKRFYSGGADGMQAMRLAMSMIEANLLSSEEARAGELTWFGEERLGLTIDDSWMPPDFTKRSFARPFLMFDGDAAEAMAFYVSLFWDGEILQDIRYGPDGPGREGTVMKGAFRVALQNVLCTDSFVSHEFGFTPAMSLFVECESEAEIERLATALSEDGATLMPLGDYGFSRHFAWVTDRFGVSWQLNSA
jgi:predicted 3-demethylubiquinone-9 3-methyltransferase (glyoxalase superfamily)